MKRLLTRYPFFLLLLPAFVIVHIERDLHGLIEYRFIYDQLLYFFLAPLVFFLLFYLVTKSTGKSALQTFAALIFFYFFGEIKNGFEKWAPGTVLTTYIFLVPVLGSLLLFALFRFYKSRSAFTNHFFIISLALLLFIAADIFIILTKPGNKSVTADEIEKNYQPCDSCAKPDIYYIIFDSYTSSAFLQKEFGLNNSAIEDSLKQRGFIIIPRSVSNYNMTIFSIGSVFNMDYIKNADTTKDYYVRDLLPAQKIIYDNRLFSLLEKENYRIFNHSIFNIRSYPSTIPLFDMWDVRELYSQYNFLIKAYRDLNYHLPERIRNIFRRDEFFVKARQRDWLDSSMMRQVMNTSALPSDKPKLVYVHFSKPHGPYTFDSSGQPVAPVPMLLHKDGKKPYAQQIGYVNKMMEEMVDTLLANAKRPIVIIIQGDHGYRFFNKEETMKEFPNFNAVYFSNRDYHLFYDSVSNVNTFRIVLNTFFKKDYALLPDRSYFLRYQ